MARPRIFVSSTYYDLKHVRSSLDNFIDSLGFESVLSEKGNIAYSPDMPLDESCYREAAGADVFVLIIGGHYGSSSSSEEKILDPSFFDRYDSITKKEYDSASARDIPIFILIEQNVYSEYQTFLRNKEDEKVQYAHVDSVNVFRLIEDILSKPRNNPVHTFERFSDIESWLREQWAGLFRELLQRMSGQKQIATLSAQVDTLGAINATLQTYLEKVLAKVSPEEAPQLIESERKRLDDIEELEELKANPFYRTAFASHPPSVEHFREALWRADTFHSFAVLLGDLEHDHGFTEQATWHGTSPLAVVELNDGRTLLDREPFPIPGHD